MTLARLMTQIFLGVVLIVGIIWDVYVDIRYGNDATISVVIRDAVRAEPMIGVAIGVALGHWFWPMQLIETLKAMVRL